MDRSRYQFADNELDKLPKWAQNRIHSLYHRVLDLEGLLTKQEPTKTRLAR